MNENLRAISAGVFPMAASAFWTSVQALSWHLRRTKSTVATQIQEEKVPLKLRQWIINKQILNFWAHWDFESEPTNIEWDRNMEVCSVCTGQL